MNDRRTLTLAAIATGASIPGFFAIFGVWGALGLPGDASSDPARVLAFAQEHPIAYAALPVLGVLMHLAALVLVAGFKARVRERLPLLADTGAAMGLLWIIADTLQNLMHYGIYLGPSTPSSVAAAQTTDALWHAGHFGGGVWILTLAASGAIGGPKWRLLSVAAGAAFTLHAFVVPLVPAFFALELLLVPAWAFATAAVVRREWR